MMRRFISLSCLLCSFATVLAEPGPLQPKEIERNAHLQDVSADLPIDKELSREEMEARDKSLAPFEKSPALEATTKGMLTDSSGRDLVMGQLLEDFLTRTESKEYEKSGSEADIKAYKEEFNKLGREYASFYAEGGCYYDSEAGLVIARKNIIVREPRFSLKCDGQLKMVLKKDPAKEAQRKEKDPEGTKVPDFTNVSYSEVDYLSLTGGVVLKRYNKNGEVEGVVGEQLVYYGENGDLVLFGKGKKIVISGEMRLETEGPGTYIRLYQDGSVYVHGDNISRMPSREMNSDKKKTPRKKITPVAVPVNQTYASLEEEFNFPQQTPDNKLMIVQAKEYSYFDALKGVVICARDVQVTDPQFSMKSDNQLKINLLKDKAREKAYLAKKAEEPADKKEKTPFIKLPDYESMFYADIDVASTSGNVVVKRVNEEGVLQGAIGELFTYDGKTGDILVSGPERKLFFNGDSLWQVTGKGSYVRMEGNGRIIGRGTTNAVIDTRKDENGKNSFSGFGGKKDKK